MPTTSAFARLFQFGMRLGLRSWTIGSAWWQADCGPYWGHNAILRVAPFKAHCAIEPLAGKGILSGHILSHDQIEAALMRRAGYDVRVLPEEDLGWEENPPTLIEFLRRDQRWLQGTLQYVFFIGLPGLKPVSRIQLLFAMLMFTGSPAWIGLWLLGTAMLATHADTSSFIDADYGAAWLALVLTMWFAPKIATVIDVLCRPALRRTAQDVDHRRDLGRKPHDEDDREQRVAGVGTDEIGGLAWRRARRADDEQPDPGRRAKNISMANASWKRLTGFMPGMNRK